MEASVAVGLVSWDVPVTPVTMDFMDSLLQDAGVRKFPTFVINTVENFIGAVVLYHSTNVSNLQCRVM